MAAGFARYVAGLPRRDSHPLYIAVWNEPNLWIEWSNAPDAVQYASFFVAVSNAIRALNDPRIRILNGALTPGNWDDTSRFMRAMLSVPGFVNAFDAWAGRYAERLRQEGSIDSKRREAMNRVNPKYILRNYLAQQAIDQAEAGDYSEIETLHCILQRPFDEQPDYEAYADAPPDWGKTLEISCSS